MYMQNHFKNKVDRSLCYRKLSKIHYLEKPQIAHLCFKNAQDTTCSLNVVSICEAYLWEVGWKKEEPEKSGDRRARRFCSLPSV